MEDPRKGLERATHADWSEGAPAVEPKFAQALVDEVLRLRSQARYEPIIRGHMIDDILVLLGIALSKETFTSIKGELEAFKTQVHAQGIPQAWLDVIAERQRQVEKLGFTHHQDDGYIYNELPRAALCYIRTAMGNPNIDPPMEWPWSLHHWKPRSPRENVVRAIALLIAEVERMDRRP